MVDRLHEILGSRIQQREVPTVFVANPEEGITVAKTLLTTLITRKTLLLLSGGKTPTELYTSLAITDAIQPGAVGLVDERYGERFHKESNEKMLRDTGLLSYFEKAAVPFHPILQGVSQEETALQYDETLRSLFTHFPVSVGLLGIGVDGHTAGLPAGIPNSQLPISKDRLVVAINNFPGPQKERISMTFTGLTFLDYLVVLVFGASKKHALEQMVAPGSREEIPARFFLEPEIRKKTLFITDQPI